MILHCVFHRTTILDNHLFNNIWHPYIVWTNLIKEDLKVESNTLTYTKSDKHYAYYKHYNLLTFLCNRNFTKFPFDEHICIFKIFSNDGFHDEIILDAVKVYDTYDYTSTEAYKNYGNIVKRSAGNYDIEIKSLEPKLYGKYSLSKTIEMSKFRSF